MFTAITIIYFMINSYIAGRFYEYRQHDSGYKETFINFLVGGPRLMYGIVKVLLEIALGQDITKL